MSTPPLRIVSLEDSTAPVRPGTKRGIVYDALRRLKPGEAMTIEQLVAATGLTEMDVKSGLSNNVHVHETKVYSTGSSIKTLVP